MTKPGAKDAFSQTLRRLLNSQYAYNAVDVALVTDCAFPFTAQVRAHLGQYALRTKEPQVLEKDELHDILTREEKQREALHATFEERWNALAPLNLIEFSPYLNDNTPFSLQIRELLERGITTVPHKDSSMKKGERASLTRKVKQALRTHLERHLEIPAIRPETLETYIKENHEQYQGKHVLIVLQDYALLDSFPHLTHKEHQKNSDPNTHHTTPHYARIAHGGIFPSQYIATRINEGVLTDPASITILSLEAYQEKGSEYKIAGLRRMLDETHIAQGRLGLHPHLHTESCAMHQFLTIQAPMLVTQYRALEYRLCNSCNAKYMRR